MLILAINMKETVFFLISQKVEKQVGLRITIKCVANSFLNLLYTVKSKDVRHNLFKRLQKQRNTITF